jgi:hypothetical protein
MKSLFIVLLLIGLIIIGIEIGKGSCKNNKIIYRYIPRTPEEESQNPVDVEDIFKDMFQKSTPWIKSSSEEDTNVRRVVY